MKQFKNLLEVLQYHSKCPFCSGKMSAGWDMAYDENSVKAYLKFGLTTLTVDCYNNNIIECRQTSSYNHLPAIGGMVSQYMGSSLSDLSAKGIDIRRLNISCESCSKYSYLIQVHISIEHGRLIALVLNSESASIEEGAKLYEVKNIYTTEKTEMSTFHTHLSQQRGALDKVELPLVPLDLQNPLKTVERIKNLIVFL